MLNLKHILAATTLALAIVAGAQCPLRFDGNETASVGIYIEEIATGKVVADYNSKMLLTPGSTLKAVTAATALGTLGPKFRFETEFNLIGPDPLSGKADMVVECSADPTTGSREFPASQHIPDSILQAMTARGVDYIAGTMIFAGGTLDQDVGVNPQWEVEDVESYYGAGLYNFNWLDNYYEKEFLIALPDVAFYEKLNEVLANNGVYFDNDSILPAPDNLSTDTLRLYTHRSAPLAEIMRVMMHKSINLYAEGILRATAPCEPRDTALRRQTAHWKKHGVDLSGAIIVDGSGLARRDALSPRQLAGVLTAMAKSGLETQYTSLFPLVGKQGTVRNFLANTKLKERLALKSGTLSGVHCYAGYLLHRKTGRPTHAVVVMVNHFVCTRFQIRKAIENYLLQILPS